MNEQDDPVWRDLHRELRKLRIAPSLFDVSAWTDCVRLVECMGRGNIDLALKAMRSLQTQHGDADSSAVQAYFLTCSGQLPGNTLETRFRNYAQRFHCVEKTALRRSDRGAQVLATLIRDEALTWRPRATVSVAQNGWAIDARMMLEAPQGMELRRPHVWVDDQRVDFGPAPHGKPDRKVDFRDLELPPIDLRQRSVSGQCLAWFELLWPLPLAPDWQLLTSLADGRLMSRLELRKGAFAYVSIEWVRERDRCAAEDLARFRQSDSSEERAGLQSRT